MLKIRVLAIKSLDMYKAGGENVVGIASAEW